MTEWQWRSATLRACDEATDALIAGHRWTPVRERVHRLAHDMLRHPDAVPMAQILHAWIGGVWAGRATAWEEQ